MIVGVASWRGTGATTVAVLVAATLASRGRTPWLVEADPAGGTLAARLDLDNSAGGLERLAFPEPRAPKDATGRFAAAAASFGAMRVVAAPGDAFRAWSCHSGRVPWVPLLRDLEDPTVVDLGRMRGATPTAPLLAQLDVLLLTATADLVSLATTVEWADTRGRMSPTDPGLALDVTRIVVVDSPTGPHRATRTDAQAELGERLAGWLPWAPDAVDLIERGYRFDDRRLRRHALAREMDDLVTRLERWTSPEVAA